MYNQIILITMKGLKVLVAGLLLYVFSAAAPLSGDNRLRYDGMLVNVPLETFTNGLTGKGYTWDDASGGFLLPGHTDGYVKVFVFTGEDGLVKVVREIRYPGNEKDCLNDFARERGRLSDSFMRLDMDETDIIHYAYINPGNLSADPDYRRHLLLDAAKAIRPTLTDRTERRVLRKLTALIRRGDTDMLNLRNQKEVDASRTLRGRLLQVAGEKAPDRVNLSRTDKDGIPVIVTTCLVAD